MFNNFDILDRNKDIIKALQKKIILQSNFIVCHELYWTFLGRITQVAPVIIHCIYYNRSVDWFERL